MSLLSMKYPKIILHICQINLLSKIRVAMPKVVDQKKESGDCTLRSALFQEAITMPVLDIASAYGFSRQTLQLF